MLLLPVPKYYENTSLDNIDGEIWKPIPFYEGLYEASNYGRVKTLPRFHHVMPNGGNLYTTLKIVRQNTCSNGNYLRVNLYKDKSPSTQMIHRIIGRTFFEGFNNKPQINHKDGIKFNNCKYNLEMCTSKENVFHAFASGLTKLQITASQACEIYNCNLPAKEIALLYNISYSWAYNLKKRKPRYMRDF